MIKIPLNKNKMLTRSRSLNFQSWIWILGQTFITYRLCRNPDAARAHGNRDNFSKMYANSTMNNGSVMKFGEQGMAQCREHSPSTNVGRVQILASKPYVGWVSLHSRRLEVVGERENGCARGRHARGEGAPARKAPENRFNSHSVSADISNWSRGSRGKN